MKLHRKISMNADRLSKLEKELLHQLIENKDKFTYKTFTIMNIAEMFKVSNTSVHRLSEKLGFKGFVQFKDEYFGNGNKEECEDEPYNDYIDFIKESYKLTLEAPIEEIIDAIYKAKKVNIYGMGMSHFLGKMFQIKLQLLGIPAEQHEDSRFMRLSSKLLSKEDDFVIILSRSGETPELLEVLVETSIRGIDVLLITEARGSTFEKMCKYKIYTGYTQDLDSNIDTRLNFHIAMDVLLKKFIEKYESKISFN